MIAPTEKTLSFRPRLVLAHDDPGYSARATRHLRVLGWEVHQTGQGAEARRLARLLDPAVVVLATELGDESGWLTCAKLVAERPGQRVVLVASRRAPPQHAFAEFVGAADLVAEGEDARALVDAVHATALPAPG